MSTGELKTGTTAVGATNVRWAGSVMVFFVCMICYLDRQVFSIAASPIMKELSLTPVQFGMTISAFSAGYFLFQIPGGISIQYWGPRVITSATLTLWSVFTALTGAVFSFMPLSAVRFLFGASEAPVFASVNQWMANWLPKEERGRGTALLNGGSFSASIIGPPILVAIIAAIGWRPSFFVCGALGVIMAITWYSFTRAKPTEHSGVNAQELAIITNGAAVAQPQKPHVPWGLLLTNRSFWGVALGGFGHIWTIQFFVFWLPYYLQAAKGLSFRDMGYFTSVPWIFIVAAVFTTGTFSDFLLKKGLSRFWARNMVSVAGLTLAAIALIISTQADDPVANILWLSLALGFVGVAQTLMWAMMTEIGQQLTSIVSSWMNTWGFIAATIVPTVAPLVARDYGWNQVLILNACVMVIAIVGFLMINTEKPLYTPE